MPLQKVPVSVPLGSGIDTKTSDALIMPARLSRLENCVFTKAGELQKRPGFDELPSFGWPTGAGDFKGALSVFDDELLVAGGGAVLSYSKVAKEWISKGALRSPSVRVSKVYADQYEQTFADCATADGITLYAFESSGGGLYASVVDEQSGTRIVPSVLVDANGSKPVVVACEKRLFIFYLHTATSTSLGIKFVRINTSAPGTFTSPASLVADGVLTYSGDYPLFTVKAFRGAMLLAYQRQSDSATRVAYVTSNGTIGGLAEGLPGEFTSAIPASVHRDCLNIAVAGDNFLVMGNILGGDLYAEAYDKDFNILVASAVIIAGVAGYDAPLRVTGCASASGGFRVYQEERQTNGPTYNARVRTCRVTLGGGVIGPTVLRRSVGLATEAFVQDNQSLVGVVYDSAIQGTLFFIDSAGLVVAKALGGSAGGMSDWSRLPNVQTLDTDIWVTAVGSKQPEQAEPANTVTTPATFSRVALDFSSERYRSHQLGRNQHVCGGVVTGYDGTRLFEAGFHVFPEKCSAAGQEWLITSKNGGPSSAISINITPPPDIIGGTSSVFSGARVRSGSYIILFANDVAHDYWWFKVDGVGSDPQPFGGSDVTGREVDLLGSDTQKVVAQKLAASIGSAAFAGGPKNWTSSVTAANVVVATPSSSVSISSTDYTPLPVQEGTFEIIATHYGDSGSAEKTVIVCPAGKWITGGQWFGLESSRQDSGSGLTFNALRAFYFKVDGVGDAPFVPDLAQTGDPSVTVPIAINSTDTPTQVATAVKNAINGVEYATGITLWSAALDAANSCRVNISCVQDTSGGTYGTISKHGWSHDVASPLVTGNRLYYALFRWTDAQGELHRSSPSEAFYSITGAAVGGANIVSVSTYRIGRRPAVSVFVDVYRTDASGQVPRRVMSLANSDSVDSLSFLDDVTDDDLQSAEIMYTAGGEVENIAPPSSASIGLHGNRLWVVDENNLLWFSKPFAEGYAVAWSDLLTMPEARRGSGTPVAVVTLDEKGIIFKTDSILFFGGDGPDNTGGGAGFTTPQEVSSDVGCISPESLVLTPDGWIFQSKKGLYLLERSLRVTYLGAPVQGFNGQDITSATLMPSVSQARFTTSAGQSLFFDYVMQQWGSNTYAARHALLWGDSYVRLGADGLVRQETPSAYVEETGAVRMLARTSWLKLADVQGFGRVYKALLLGRYISKHRLNVEIEYDYDETTRETLSFDAGASIGGSLYGSGSTYGSDDPYGGSAEPAVEQLDIRPAIQKCEAIRFTIYDDPTDSGESLALVHLQLIVGVKGPAYRLGPSRTPGN